jgi:hypothetical protein
MENFSKLNPKIIDQQQMSSLKEKAQHITELKIEKNSISNSLQKVILKNGGIFSLEKTTFLVEKK